jgi:glutamyl-tRNA synthetase
MRLDRVGNTGVIGRYAPSPSGRQHLGNARTALLAWLFARSAGGRFVLRVEDLDPTRSQRIHEETILADLRWLGIDWDEGPDVGGSHGPYRQSERNEIYAEAIARLETFACTCSRRELRESAAAPHGIEPVYPGTCLQRPIDPTRPVATRWHAPRGTVEANDARLGTLVQDVAHDIGDFVLRRGDGAWAYQLAVVVDDAAMGVTEVVRGEDLWTSTPRQVLLQRALGLPTPQYAHVPLLRGADGTKLSKRHGAPDVAALRERGVDPHRVVAALARSCGLLENDTREIDVHALLAAFDRTRVGTRDAPLVLDPDLALQPPTR